MFVVYSLFRMGMQVMCNVFVVMLCVLDSISSVLFIGVLLLLKIDSSVQVSGDGCLICRLKLVWCWIISSVGVVFSIGFRVLFLCIGYWQFSICISGEIVSILLFLGMWCSDCLVLCVLMCSDCCVFLQCVSFVVQVGSVSVFCIVSQVVNLLVICGNNGVWQVWWVQQCFIVLCQCGVFNCCCRCGRLLVSRVFRLLMYRWW